MDRTSFQNALADMHALKPEQRSRAERLREMLPPESFDALHASLREENGRLAEFLKEGQDALDGMQHLSQELEVKIKGEERRDRAAEEQTSTKRDLHRIENILSQES